MHFSQDEIWNAVEARNQNLEIVKNDKNLTVSLQKIINFANKDSQEKIKLEKSKLHKSPSEDTSVAARHLFFQNVPEEKITSLKFTNDWKEVNFINTFAFQKKYFYL